MDELKARPGFRELHNEILSDRCWDCEDAKAQGKCPDCDCPGEMCADCLRQHQASAHGDLSFEQAGK